MRPRCLIARKPQPTVFDAAAADWLMAHDQGLSSEQEREFQRWLAADPRHGAAWQDVQQAWARLDRLPELTPLSDASVFRRVWPVLASAAAVLLLGFFLWPRLPAPAAAPTAELVREAPRQLTLSDGTRVELNGDSEVAEHFTPLERRVRLIRGEAHFAVVKNPARPFFVEAGGVTVRAVGTAFNVRLDQAALEVLVTEGRVRVDPAPAAPTSDGTPSRDLVTPSAATPPPELVAGHRAVVTLTSAARPLEISVLSPEEISRALAWQGMRLHFEDMPLEQVAAEFNRHNRTRLIVDRSAADILVAGSFRAENVDVFVRFLREGFGISADARSDDTIVLRRTR